MHACPRTPASRAAFERLTGHNLLNSFNTPEHADSPIPAKAKELKAAPRQGLPAMDSRAHRELSGDSRHGAIDVRLNCSPRNSPTCASKLISELSDAPVRAGHRHASTRSASGIAVVLFFVAHGILHPDLGDPLHRAEARGGQRSVRQARRGQVRQRDRRAVVGRARPVVAGAGQHAERSCGRASMPTARRRRPIVPAPWRASASSRRSMPRRSTWSWPTISTTSSTEPGRAEAHVARRRRISAGLAALRCGAPGRLEPRGVLPGRRRGSATRSRRCASPPASQFVVGSRTLQTIVSPIVDGDGKRIGTVVEWQDRTQEVATEKEIGDLVAAVSDGKLDQRMSMAGKRASSKCWPRAQRPGDQRQTKWSRKCRAWCRRPTEATSRARCSSPASRACTSRSAPASTRWSATWPASSRR